MRACWQRHLDRIAGLHAATAKHHAHHAGFAHQRALRIAVEHGRQQAWPEVIDLAAGVAQAGEPHER